MKCNKCGQVLPEDSGFCQYCGTKVEVEEEILINKEPEIITKPAKSKEYSSKSKLFLGGTVIIVIALIGLNIYQFMSADAFKTEINTLNEEVAYLNKQLDDKQEKVDYYMGKYNESRPKATDYDKIAEFVNKDYAGYGNSNYHADRKVVVLKKTDSVEKISIKANLGQNVTYYFSCASSIIDAEWGGWSGAYTSVSVKPNLSGITTIRFTNDYNSIYFDVMVVVI